MEPNPFASTPFSYLCYTASIWLFSAILSNGLDMSVAFQCRVGRSDQELWKSRSSEQSALFPFKFHLFTLSYPTWSVPSFFPLAPSAPARFIRYHCYVHLLGRSPFWMLSVNLSGCAYPSLYPRAARHTNGHVAIRPQHCLMWFMHEAGQRVWLYDDGRGRKTRW